MHNSLLCELYYTLFANCLLSLVHIFNERHGFHHCPTYNICFDTLLSNFLLAYYMSTLSRLAHEFILWIFKNYFLKLYIFNNKYHSEIVNVLVCEHDQSRPLPICIHMQFSYIQQPSSPQCIGNIGMAPNTVNKKVGKVLITKVVNLFIESCY